MIMSPRPASFLSSFRHLLSGTSSTRVARRKRRIVMYGAYLFRYRYIVTGAKTTSSAAHHPKTAPS